MAGDCPFFSLKSVCKSDGGFCRWHLFHLRVSRTVDWLLNQERARVAEMNAQGSPIRSTRICLVWLVPNFFGSDFRSNSPQFIGSATSVDTLKNLRLVASSGGSKGK